MSALFDMKWNQHPNDPMSKPEPFADVLTRMAKEDPARFSLPPTQTLGAAVDPTTQRAVSPQSGDVAAPKKRAGSVLDFFMHSY